MAKVNPKNGIKIKSETSPQDKFKSEIFHWLQNTKIFQ